jgi:hypothetical protein
MASKKEYAEKLKSPKWQKKRLEVLERDEFRCLQCGSEDKTLHVHHLFYEFGLDPWEYQTDSLETLCEDCHKTAEENKKEIKSFVKYIGRLDSAHLIGYIKGFLLMGGEYCGYVPNCAESLDGFMNATFGSIPYPKITRNVLFAMCTNKELPLSVNECRKAINMLKKIK